MEGAVVLACVYDRSKSLTIHWTESLDGMCSPHAFDFKDRL